MYKSKYEKNKTKKKNISCAQIKSSSTIYKQMTYISISSVHDFCAHWKTQHGWQYLKWPILITD